MIRCYLMKTLYLESSVFGILTKYISTLALNSNLGGGGGGAFHFVEIHFSI